MKKAIRADRSGNSWSWIGSSVVGDAHFLSQTPCQDSHAIQEHDGRLTIAVSDGAGSANRSEVGSKSAAHAALCYLSNVKGTVGEGEVIAAFRAARDAVLAQADQLGVSEEELAATLIVASIDREGLVVGQVGDGAVVARIDGATLTASRPQNGEYINVTSFITSINWEESLTVASCEGDVQCVAVFTDGIEPVALKMPEGEPFEPFFDAIFRFLDQVRDRNEAEAELDRFLSSDRLRDRTDDDLTLVIARSNMGAKLA